MVIIVKRLFKSPCMRVIAGPPYIELLRKPHKSKLMEEQGFLAVSLAQEQPF